MTGRPLLARRLALNSGLTLALAGCSSVFGSSPTELDLTLRVGDRINVNELEQPTPLVLRTYELKSSEAFLASDFFDLYDRESTRLGADLLARREFTLIPGRSLEQPRRNLSDETRFLGALAAFRSIDGTEWRMAAPIQPNRRNRLTLVVEGRSIALRPT